MGISSFFPIRLRADVSFIRWERFPDRKLPKAAIYDVAPDLAVEVLSESNTAAEMNRKLRDYFKAGTSMVWYIDPPTRTALRTSPLGSGPISARKIRCWAAKCCRDSSCRWRNCLHASGESPREPLRHDGPRAGPAAGRGLNYQISEFLARL